MHVYFALIPRILVCPIHGMRTLVFADGDLATMTAEGVTKSFLHPADALVDT